MFIIDFDDTLFNTQKFKQARLRAMRRLAISDEQFWDSYKKAYKTGKRHVYSDENHAAVLGKFGFDKKRVLAALKKTTVDLQKFLFRDTFAFLKKIKARKQPMALLSLGEPGFIKLKVDRSGVRQYFNKVFIVDDSKKNVVKKLIGKSEGEHWLINDKINESLELKKKFPHLKIVLKKSPLWSAAEYKKSGLPYFSSLTKIYDHIKKS